MVIYMFLNGHMEAYTFSLAGAIPNSSTVVIPSANPPPAGWGVGQRMFEYQQPAKVKKKKGVLDFIVLIVLINRYFPRGDVFDLRCRH